MIAPARTGRDNNNKIAVIFTDHVNRVNCSKRISLGRTLMIVEMKFKAPKIEDTPAKWREKIARSTAGPA